MPYNHRTYSLQTFYLCYATVRLILLQMLRLSHNNCPTYAIRTTRLILQPSNLSLFSNALLILYNCPTYPLQPPNLSHTITQLTRFNCSTYPNTTVRLIPLLIPYNHRWLCQKCDIVDTTFHASCVPGPCTATQSTLPTLRGKTERPH